MDFRRYVRDRLPPRAVRREPEIVDEWAQHLAELYQEALAAGASEPDARASACAALSEHPLQLAREIESASRALPAVIADRWLTAASEPAPTKGTFPMLGDLRRDVAYAIRMMAAAPGFTITVAVTLALGIGATAIIFTAFDAILVRTPGISDPSSLVAVYNASTDRTEQFAVLSHPDYADVRDSGIFADIAAFGGISLALELGGEVQPVAGQIVTGNYFRVLGTRMAMGRSFLPDEDRPGTDARPVIVSHTFWRNRLGGNPSIINTPLTLNGTVFTIVGVTPPLFAGAAVGSAPEVWAPMALQPEMRPPSAGLRRSLGTSDLLNQRSPRWLSAVARMGPGADATSSLAALDVVAKRLQAAYPATNRTRTFNVTALGEGPGLRATTRPMLRLLAIAVGLVLLIACANVASLLLARSVSRRREVAVRMALGAGGGRLLRQWLTEASLLASIGGMAGLVLTQWGAPLLHLAGIPATIPLEVNLRVVLFTFAVAVVSAISVGLAPVVQITRRDTVEALRDEGGAVATGTHAARLRRAFVVFQVAVGLVLLAGAGLFLRTLQNAQAVELGYQLHATMVADINLDVRGYSQEAGRQVYLRVLDRLRGMPGVAAAGAARITVLSGGARTTTISVDGRPLAQDGSNGMDVRVNVVSDGYLDSLGIRLLRGRDFQRYDEAGVPRVAIVSEALASRLWPNQDPLGRTFGTGSPPLTVIGVAPDTVYRSVLERQPLPFFYLPLSQNYESGVALHVRAAAGDPLSLLPAVRTAVREVDPRIVVARPQRLAEVFDQSLTYQRMMATLVSFFGGTALLLAAVGLYGVMSHLVGQRRAEIGIRFALGARPHSIFKLVLGEALRLVAIGTALGLAGAFVATRYVETQLFGVTPVDPLTLLGACVLLAGVAALACLIPARRAMRVDPVVALRTT